MHEKENMWTTLVLEDRITPFIFILLAAVSLILSHTRVTVFVLRTKESLFGYDLQSQFALPWVWKALWIIELRESLWPLCLLSSKECWIINYIFNQRFPFTLILYFPMDLTWFTMLNALWGEVWVTLVFLWREDVHWLR